MATEVSGGGDDTGQEDDLEREGGVGMGRLLAFSDGVFAIAFTILVLDIVVPDGLSPQALKAALVEQLPSIWSAVLSFAVIGRFWISHHHMLGLVRRPDAGVLVLNTALLATIAMIPYTTSLLAEYGDETVAVVVYSATVAATAGLQLVLLWWSVRRRLLEPRTSRNELVDTVGGLTGAVLAFVVAIPVAFASPTAGELCWLLAFVPVGPIMRRWSRADG